LTFGPRFTGSDQGALVSAEEDHCRGLELSPNSPTARNRSSRGGNFEIEPAFAALRGNPRFEAFRARVQAHIAAQRRELERLRAEGLLPERSAER